MRLLPILLLCAGCSTWQPVEEYDVPSFRLVLGSRAYIQEMWFATTGSDRQVGGFCDYGNKVIYVPYSVNLDEYGRLKPDFTVLGHEVWHFEELGGRFHE